MGNARARGTYLQRKSEAILLRRRRRQIDPAPPAHNLAPIDIQLEHAKDGGPPKYKITTLQDGSVLTDSRGRAYIYTRSGLRRAAIVKGDA